MKHSASNPPRRSKYQVAQQFSRAAASYDHAANIQKRTSKQLLELMPRNNQGTWLDIGCGTGTAFAPLLNSGITHLYGLDLAAGMLQYAQQQLAIQWPSHRVTLLHGDAEQLPFAYNSLDGIFSSLMLQWSEQTAQTLAEWCRILKPGGQLALATLLPGTQQELKQAWRQLDARPHVNTFVPLPQLLTYIQQAHLQLQSQQTQCLREYYASLPDLLRSLKAIGATNVNLGRANGLGGRTALQKLEKAYPRNSQNTFTLSYQVCWLIAYKSTESI